MKNPTVSVIVPVYRAEKFLRKNVESILVQTFTDFELWLVDDGSPDSSGEICDELARKDSRIRVHHQVNAGPSVARNYALDHAAGEWICFMDADDYVEPHWLEMYVQNLDADVIFQGVNVISTDGSTKVLKLGSQHERGDARFKILAQSPTCIINATWTKCVRAKVIHDNHLRFDETCKLSEDLIFLLDFMKVSETARTIEHVGYNYILAHSTLTTIRHDAATLLHIKGHVLDALDRLFEGKMDNAAYCKICTNEMGYALFFFMVQSFRTPRETRFEAYHWFRGYWGYVDFRKLEWNRQVFRLLQLPLPLFDLLLITYARLYHWVSKTLKR